MSIGTPPPLAIIEEGIPNAKKSRRGAKTTRIRGSRPGFWVYAPLLVVLLSALFPLYWSFIIGSGDSTTLRGSFPWIPGGNFISNAASVVNNEAVNFWPALWNSIYSSFLIAAAVVITSTLAGWAVPQQLGVVPLYILFSELGWTGQIGAIIIPALTSAFGVFWMTQYLGQTVPDELIEAARVDGATMFRTFLTVGLPAARPAAAMLFLFTFVGAWNNFFWPFIVLDRQNPTLPVALSLLQSNYFVDYSIVLAGVVLATIPLLLLFIFAGKQLVSGIMAGAVKG